MTTVNINSVTGLTGDGFLSAASLCGTGTVHDYYQQAYGKTIHVGRDGPCGVANNTYRAYVRFSLSSITGTVTSASFYFHLWQKLGANYGVILYEISDFGTLDYSDWSYSFRANLGEVLSPSSALGWHSVNVTSRVQAAKAAALSYIAFVFVYKNESESTPGGTSHWYALTAADEGILTPYLNVTYTPPAPPTAPSGCSATWATNTQINISWADNSSNETGFKVYRSVDGAAYALLDTVGANTTSTSDTSVSRDHYYNYKVLAYNGDGNSSYSNVSTTIPTIPAAPTSFEGEAISSTRIDLTWVDPNYDDSQEHEYSLERSDDSGAYAEIDTPAQDAVSYSDTSVVSGHEYAYKLRAWNGSGYSSYTDAVTISTAITAPSDCTATPKPGGSQIITWGDESDNEDGFKVERGTKGVYSQINAPGAGVETYTDDPVPGYHTYRVKAYNATNDSSYSTWAGTKGTLVT